MNDSPRTGRRARLAGFFTRKYLLRRFIVKVKAEFCAAAQPQAANGMGKNGTGAVKPVTNL
jgi:hypothetical protein